MPRPQSLVVASSLALAFSASLLAFQASPQSAAATAAQVPKVSYEAPAALQHTDLPNWPYVPTPPPGSPAPPPDDGQPHHLPGSTKAFTLKEIDGLSAVDWFPDLHPPAPKSVTEGRDGVYRACGTCHLMNGYGKSDTANLNGLPVGYMLQQMEDMKNDLRHAAVKNMGIISMIPVAKAIPPEDAREAAEYFHSVPKSKDWVKIVEAEIVPKTMPAPHRMLAVDPSGAKEPIGNRIIELPLSFERTALRDPTSSFVAYVPVGSVKRGEALVKTGGNGRTVACATCHGADLRGMGDTIPPIAGRSPSAMGRQLYDFKTGARHGANAVLMAAPVAKLTDEDIVDIAAYLGTLEQ